MNLKVGFIDSFSPTYRHNVFPQIIGQAQQLFEDDKITAPEDNLMRSTDDELRNMLANLLTDNAKLRKQVNSAMRRALKTGTISRSSTDGAPSSNNHVER